MTPPSGFLFQKLIKYPKAEMGLISASQVLGSQTYAHWAWVCLLCLSYFAPGTFSWVCFWPFFHSGDLHLLTVCELMSPFPSLRVWHSQSPASSDMPDLQGHLQGAREAPYSFSA